VFHSPEGKNLNSGGWQPTERGDKWVTTSEGSNKSVVMCCSTPSGSVSISRLHRGCTAIELRKLASETEAYFSPSADEGGGVVRSRVAKRNNGTLRTASLPAGRDVVPNVPDLFGGVGTRALWRGRGAPAERVSDPDCCGSGRSLVLLDFPSPRSFLAERGSAWKKYSRALNQRQWGRGEGEPLRK